MLDVLDVIAVEDQITEGDFWRDQPFLQLPKLSTLRPKCYRNLVDGQSLKGKTIGVPRMYIGKEDPQAQPVHTRQSVIDLWTQARTDLEALGATVVEVEFPVVTNYESHGPDTTLNVKGLPDHWGEAERGVVIAYSWDDFLLTNNDPALPSASAVDAPRIFPRNSDEIQWKYSEISNLVGYDTLFDVLWDRGSKSIFEISGFKQACLALEATRKKDLEDWMEFNELDLIVFPANGDVGQANADINDDSARHAWKNGVKYSNGNRALRHLGVPSVSVTMGIMEDTMMPVGLTFVSKAYDDNNLLRYAYAYEQKSKRRRPPPLTPSLDTDEIGSSQQVSARPDGKPVELILKGCRKDSSHAGKVTVELAGTLRLAGGLDIASFTVYVDGEKVNGINVDADGNWEVVEETNMPQVPDHVKTEAAIARSKIMVVALVKSGAGIDSGTMLLL
jgi:amidase